MPIYESSELTREQLETIRQRNLCAVCGGWLNLFFDPEKKLAFVACADWPRTQHEGIEREPSRYEKGGLSEFTIEKRREIMDEQLGKEKTRALARYMGGVPTMTKSIATEIVETLWGEAPVIEKTKAILLCQTYQLNPLLNHLHLVGYRRRVDGKFVKDSRGNFEKDWSLQIGIGATRLLAQRKHNFSYMDFSPRKATQTEIDKILGDTADPDCVYGFVHIKDVETGAEAFGLRGIGKHESIKGTEKGNTHLNMACIRSERLALDRQYPGEMPSNVEVVDEKYMEVEMPDVDKADLHTDEIIEGEAIELEPEPEKTLDEEIPDPEQPPPEPVVDESPASKADIAELQKWMGKAAATMSDLGQMIANELKWEMPKTLPGLKKWQVAKLIEIYRKSVGE